MTMGRRRDEISHRGAVEATEAESRGETSVRTLFEIIDEAKGGGRPEYDELRYALVALDALHNFDTRELMRLGAMYRDGKKFCITLDPWRSYEESFKRIKAALGKSPKEWLGPNNDPDSPLVQKRRAAALKLFDRVMAKEDAKNQSASSDT